MNRYVRIISNLFFIFSGSLVSFALWLSTTEAEAGIYWTFAILFAVLGITVQSWALKIMDLDCKEKIRNARRKKNG